MEEYITRYQLPRHHAYISTSSKQKRMSSVDTKIGMWWACLLVTRSHPQLGNREEGEEPLNVRMETTRVWLTRGSRGTRDKEAREEWIRSYLRKSLITIESIVWSLNSTRLTRPTCGRIESCLKDINNDPSRMYERQSINTTNSTHCHLYFFRQFFVASAPVRRGG